MKHLYFGKRAYAKVCAKLVRARSAAQAVRKVAKAARKVKNADYCEINQRVL